MNRSKLASFDSSHLSIFRSSPEAHQWPSLSVDIVQEAPAHQVICLLRTEREVERAVYIARRMEAAAHRRETMICQTPKVIFLPAAPCTEEPTLEEYVPPKITVPVTGLVMTSEGRIGPEILIEEKAPRLLVELEEELYTKDLKVADERLLAHDWEFNRNYLNSCRDAYRTKDQELHLQDSGMKLSTWIKVSALELGVPVWDFYKRLATGEVIDRFMITILVGHWKLTMDQIVEHAARLSYILTAYYRHIKFEDMKTPFLVWPFDKYVAFMTGRKQKTAAERDAEKAAKYEKEKTNPSVITPTDPEKKIVAIIKKGLEVKIISLSDLSKVQYLEKAQLAYRRELSDEKFRNLKSAYYGTQSICKDTTTIKTLTDAKYLFRQHMGEGVPHELIRDCISARIEDDPDLAAQREARGYKTAHSYLINELQVEFDPCRAILIGRIYLRNEAIILRLMGNVDTEVKLSKLLNFEKAIENHGDQPELIVRFLGPDITVAVWDIFAQHRDYEKYLMGNRMTQAKIKDARRILFEYHTKKMTLTPREREMGITGESVHIFSIVLVEEKNFLDRCLRDPDYLNGYVQKYAWYQDHGYLP